LNFSAVEISKRFILSHRSPPNLADTRRPNLGGRYKGIGGSATIVRSNIAPPLRSRKTTQRLRSRTRLANALPTGGIAIVVSAGVGKLGALEIARIVAASARATSVLGWMPSR
jgi:hypothetical protein